MVMSLNEMEVIGIQIVGESKDWGVQQSEAQGLGSPAGNDCPKVEAHANTLRQCFVLLAGIEAVKIPVGADVWENQHDIRELTNSTCDGKPFPDPSVEKRDRQEKKIKYGGLWGKNAAVLGRKLQSLKRRQDCEEVLDESQMSTKQFEIAPKEFKLVAEVTLEVDTVVREVADLDAALGVYVAEEPHLTRIVVEPSIGDEMPSRGYAQLIDGGPSLRKKFGRLMAEAQNTSVEDVAVRDREQPSGEV
eukprot:Gb_27477 [translate_table: standard]